MKFGLLSLLAWVLICTHAEGWPQSDGVNDQRLAVAKILVHAKLKDQTGAAIYVGNDQQYGYFVTAYHTIDPENVGTIKSVEVQMYNSSGFFEGELVDRFDRSLDLGIIKTRIKNIPTQIKQLIVKDPTPVTAIMIIGHGVSGDWSVWAGRVVNENGPSGDSRHFIVNRDYSLTPGYSGGGIFDVEGNFLGMHRETDAFYGRNLKSREILHSLEAFRVPTNNFGGTTNPASVTSFAAIPKTDQFTTIQFSASTYNITEGAGFINATITRSGDTSNIASVTYATSNDTAKENKDYVATHGVLNFNAGEISRTFPILVVDNAFVDGTRKVNLALTNPIGGTLAQSTAVLTIIDNDLVAGLNPLDVPRSFVQYQYSDFMGKYPDKSGWDFWTNQITTCGSDVQCIEVQRINISAAFFLSIEFQQTGYLVERFYKVAYGDATGTSKFGGAHALPVPIIRFDEFLRDHKRIGRGVVVLAPGWEQHLESNKQAYALEFMQTSRFITAFPTTLTPAQFVDQLNQRAGNVLSASERTTVINLFGGAGNTTNTTARAQAVRQVAEDTDLQNAEFNRFFVLAEYFGYLRRNPNDAPEPTLDYTGFDTWLTKLNQFNGNYIKAEMVKRFLSSIEYRQRFGP